MHIAYQVVGDGPFDMVFVPGFVSNVEAVWSSPPRARFLQGLASFCRLMQALLRRGALRLAFDLGDQLEADVPMSLADACLVRMTETLADSLLLTTDGDFRIYRRHGRQVVPRRFPT